MGERIVGLENKASNNPWHDAHAVISEVTSEAGTRYAVVGSRAYSAIINEDLHPKDLDILLMCPEQERLYVAEQLRQSWSTTFPNLDLSELVYRGKLVFYAPDKAFLQFKNLKVPVDPSVFAVSDIHYDCTNFPVFHPATYIAFMEMSVPSSKVDSRINTLNQALSEGVANSVPEPNLTSLREFDQHVNKKFMLQVRHKLHRLEESGNKSVIIKAKRFLREEHPAFAQLIRSIIG